MKKATFIKSTLSGLACLAGASLASGQLEYDQATFWKQEHITKGLLRMYEVNTVVEPKLKGEDEQLVLKQATELMATGDVGTPQALTIMETAANAPESSSAIKYLVGAIYAQEGNQDKALEWFKKSLKQFPNYQKAQRNVGIMLATKSEFVEALPFLIRAVELGASDNTTYGLVGLCYVNTDKFISAESAYRQATVLDPSVKDWQLGLARALILQNKHAEAINVLDELLTTDPENDIIWAQQGSSYVALEDIDSAVANFEVVERLGKATPEILELMGQIYMDKGLDKLAVSSFKKAIGKDENRSVKTYVDIADLMVGYGSMQGAQEYINEIRARFGKKFDREQEIRLLRMESRITLTIGSPDSVVPILERLIENDPLDSGALMMLANYHSGLDSNDGYARADIYYERTAKIDDIDIEVDALIAWAGSYVARELYSKAIPKLERAQTLKPQEHIGRYLEQVRKINAANLGL